MSVDGRKLTDTLRLGSDIYNEHPCSPCAKDNKNVGAIKYCKDCDENICGKCASDHKRFAVMRGHQIEDRPRNQTGQKTLDLPTTRCDKHGGKLIDVYCPLHDIVGCSTCVAIEHRSDKGTCDITGVCILENGNIVMVDHANMHLKKMSNDFTVTELIDLPDNPCEICEVDSQQLAVTLINKKKVQFVSQKVLTLGISFAVGDRCRGIACHNSFLYVCCGGRRKAKGEGPGHIEVYSLTGQLMRSFTEGFQYPNSLFYLHTRNELIVSEFISELPAVSRVVVIDLYDHSVSEIKTEKLVLPLEFCMIEDDRICIAGYQSNNVVLVSKDGQVQQELLTEQNGLMKPYNVRFDEKRKLLIVPLDTNNKFKVFQLE